MIVLQLVTVYQHVACLAAIPASYAGHRLMVETIQVILIADVKIDPLLCTAAN